MRSLSSIALVALFLFPVSLWAETAGVEPSGPLKYSWVGKKMPGAIWGIAEGDLDGDGISETLLLKRREILIGSLDPEGFKEKALCQLPNLAQGARIYAINLDDEPGDEIVVSALEEGSPSSLALKFDGKGCRAILERARYSLRVAPDEQGVNKLFAQGWSSDSYFFGPISEAKLEGKKLSRGKKLSLPRNTRLYQFTFIPGGDETRVALLPGYERMEVKEAKGRKFKRIWRSPDRMGGSPNQLPASQRDILGSEESGGVIFDIPPVIATRGEGLAVLALQSSMLVRNVIGRKPAISGSRIVGFVEDPAFGFVSGVRTIELPSCISDFMVDKAGNRLTAVMLDECGLFDKVTESQIITFEITGY